jgi:hypothetical protein
MQDQDGNVPNYLFIIHPGGGDCGLKGLQKEGLSGFTNQYIYRCSCGFRWFLSVSEIRSLCTDRSQSEPISNT